MIYDGTSYGGRNSRSLCITKGWPIGDGYMVRVYLVSGPNLAIPWPTTLVFGGNSWSIVLGMGDSS